METKKCTKCGYNKVLTEYNYRNKNKLYSICKECKKQYLKEYHLTNIEKEKAYRLTNKEKRNEYNRNYKIMIKKEMRHCKQCLKFKSLDSFHKKIHVCKKCQSKSYYESNKEKILLYSKNYNRTEKRKQYLQDYDICRYYNIKINDSYPIYNLIKQNRILRRRIKKIKAGVENETTKQG